MIHWRVATIVGPSSIHGSGRFADEPIPAGEIVLSIDGDITRNNNNSYVNHSKGQNLDYVGNRTWVANRHIDRGEELTMDYLQWIKELPF